MKTRGILEQVLLIGLGLVTLVITPYNSIDPVNLPKLSMLAFFGIVAVSFIVPGFKDLIRSNFRILSYSRCCLPFNFFAFPFRDRASDNSSMA